MICPNCGKQVPDYGLYCWFCGRSFLPPDRPAEPPETALPPEDAGHEDNEKEAARTEQQNIPDVPVETVPPHREAAAGHAAAAHPAPEQAAKASSAAKQPRPATAPVTAKKALLPAGSGRSDRSPDRRGGKWLRWLLALAAIIAALALVWGLVLAPSARYDRAMHKAAACMEQSDFDAALDYYSKAAAIDATKEALLGQAAACLNLGRPEEALRAYEALLQLDPDREATYAAMADVYLALGEYRQALTLLEQGIGRTRSARLEQQLNALLEQLDITNYTAEQIAADPHIWAVGAPAEPQGTAPDSDVVALFDGDSGTLTFRRNGLDSDGRMADLVSFDEEGTADAAGQPWRELREQITRAEIGGGLVNLGAGALCGCTELTSVSIGADVSELGRSACADCAALTQVDFAEASRLTKVGADAFRGCSALTGVSLPDTVESLGSGCFAGSGLQELTLPDSLTLLTQGALNDCPALSEVTVNTAMADLGPVPFYRCPSLTVINVSTDNLHYSAYDGLLYDKSGSTLLRCPEGRESCGFAPTMTAVGERACYACGKLAAASLPAGVTEIGREAFAFCPRLSYVYLPASLTDIGSRAFVYCGALAGFELDGGSKSFQLGGDLLLSGDGTELLCCPPASSTGRNPGVLRLPRSVRTVAEGACVGCGMSGLICLGVTTIGASAFADCPALSSAVLPESVAAIGPGAFSGSPELVIYCKAGSYAEQYAQTAGYQTQTVTDFLLNIFN